MRMQRNYYEVLGVPRNASKQEIKEQYHALARQYHPDRAKDKELADRLFVQINRAYTTLSSEVKRAQYDAKLEFYGSDPGLEIPRHKYSPSPSPSPSPTAQSTQSAAAAQPSPQAIREWFDKASRLQIKGDLAEAIKWAAKVLDADPKHFPGMVLMGDLYSQSGKPVEALAMFTRASDIQPANSRLREKIMRLTAVNARRATNPNLNRQQTPPPSSAVRPNVPPQNVAPPPQRPAPAAPAPPTPPPSAPAAPEKPAASPAPKSLFDRLMHRK